MTDRSQSVCIGYTSFKFLPVFSGVPQDSILGPLLFVVYIDELFRAIESHPTCHLLLYADDAKVFSTNPTDLQHASSDWSRCLLEHQLSLAPCKCEHLAVSRCGESVHNFFIDA